MRQLVSCETNITAVFFISDKIIIRYWFNNPSLWNMEPTIQSYESGNHEMKKPVLKLRIQTIKVKNSPQLAFKNPRRTVRKNIHTKRLCEMVFHLWSSISQKILMLFLIYACFVSRIFSQLEV